MPFPDQTFFYGIRDDGIIGISCSVTNCDMGDGFIIGHFQYDTTLEPGETIGGLTYDEFIRLAGDQRVGYFDTDEAGKVIGFNEPRPEDDNENSAESS